VSGDGESAGMTQSQVMGAPRVPLAAPRELGHDRPEHSQRRAHVPLRHRRRNCDHPRVQGTNDHGKYRSRQPGCGM
jgi:hypothetical protein